MSLENSSNVIGNNSIRRNKVINPRPDVKKILTVSTEIVIDLYLYYNLFPKSIDCKINMLQLVRCDVEHLCQNNFNFPLEIALSHSGHASCSLPGQI